MVTTLVVAGFIFNTPTGYSPAGIAAQHSPAQLSRCPRSHSPAEGAPHPAAPARRKTSRYPSDIPLKTGEGLRAAFYVPYDATSYSSFKEHVHQIDLLFPDWMHVNAPNPELLAMSSENTLREYQVIDKGTVHDPDDLNKIKNVIEETREDTEVFPHLNNFNPHTQAWDPAIGDLLADGAKRSALKAQIIQFFSALPAYRGPLSLDFENLRDEQYPVYMTFIQEALLRASCAQPAALCQYRLGH